MDLGLAGKRALVTGSTAGIGFASAEVLGREGAHVIINGRTSQRIDAALAKLRKAVPSAKFEGVAADVATADGCAQLIRSVPDVIAYVCSTAASATTGAALRVDGGVIRAIT